ncbi:peroxynitrite isomerase THAP4-like [Danaus plexippus]|uniref:peroxynitrite isomerase THAP4-like n=1 Tax=Danaus plexippus TaxID=13037 RepID=UPI002AAFF1F6|nr:peroxynitrite isomerase THAP4-like [Danaus plexippus]
MQSEDVHEALSPISWLAGRWKTEAGEGHFPNLHDFHYHEELEFICIGQPMFNYTSISRHPEKQTPMHQERGFLKIKPGTNEVAFMVSHNFGLTSLEEGQCSVQNKEIKLTTTNLTRCSFSKPPHVKRFERKFKLLEPELLEVILYMETDSTPLSEHLRAVYKKV